MSQDLYFYKRKFLLEEIVQDFTHEEINSAIKSLLKKRNLEEDTHLRNELFEEIQINSFSISAYDNRIDKKLTKSVFLSPQSRLLMVKQSFWLAIKTIVDAKKKELQSNLDNRETLSKLEVDYLTLEKLFGEKLLFINIQ